MANVEAAVGANIDQGEQELNKLANPFYVSKGIGIGCVIAGFILGTVIYVGTIMGLNHSLSKAIENADALTAIVRTSPTYPPEPADTSPPQDEIDPASLTKVDDLALALWVKELKLAPPATEIQTLIEDPRYRFIFAALRFGSPCRAAGDEGEWGQLRPLEMRTVYRLDEFGKFLSSLNCRDVEGNPSENRAIGSAIRAIAGITGDEKSWCIPLSLSTRGPGRGCVPLFFPASRPSGKAIVRQIMIDNRVFESLATEKYPKTDESGKDPNRPSDDVPALIEAWDRLDEAKKGLAGASGDDAVAKANNAIAEATKNYEDIQRSTAVPVEDAKLYREARQTLRELLTMSNDMNPAKLSLEGDPAIQALESFAIGLIAAIDSDPEVTSMRGWLAAARGLEQYLILVLALIAAFLMGERALRFRRHALEVTHVSGVLVEGIEALDTANLPRPPAGEQPAQRSERRALQATSALQRLNFLRDAEAQIGPDASRIVLDIEDAAQSDLSQINLYGLSDERVDKSAQDLREKIDSSRQMIEWAITTLPALGFLGTVHGIMNALGVVSGLTQGDAAARLASLLDISASLGLAFSTTLIALIFMIILSFIDTWQGRSEKALIDSFRDLVTVKVLP